MGRQTDTGRHQDQLDTMSEPNDTFGPHRGGTLLGRLLRRGWEFDFFQAAWLLERYGIDRTPLGDRGPVASEGLRFRPHIALGFPSTDLRRVTEIENATSGSQFYQLDVTFMGLYGVATPLPLHYAISILRSVERSPVAGSRANDSGDSAETDSTEFDSSPTRDFLDIFHHRILSLFYRAWTKYRYDKTFGMAQRDSITGYMLKLIGCLDGFDESAVGVDPVRLIRYSGLLTQHPMSAVSIEGMLADFWDGIEVHVDQFVGRWVPLAPVDMNHIGVTNSEPGLNLILGEQVYDLSGAFGVTLGPMNWETYLRFLPDGESFAQTRSLVQLACPDPLAFTFEIKLEADQVPPLQLCSDDQASRLGYTSWVRTDEMAETSVVFDASPERPMPPRAAKQAAGPSVDASREPVSTG